VPSGTPVQDNCGDTFWPTQLGLFDKLLATFTGIIWPSLKVVDVNVNGSAACMAIADATTIAAAAIIFRKSRCANIRNPPLKFTADFITRYIREENCAQRDLRIERCCACAEEQHKKYSAEKRFLIWPPLY